MKHYNRVPFQASFQASFQVLKMNYNQEQIAFPPAYQPWKQTDCALFEFFDLTTGSAHIRLHSAADPVFFTNISYDRGNKRVMLYEGGSYSRYLDNAEGITLYEVLVLLGFGRRGWGDNSTGDVIHTIRIEQCDDGQMTVVGLLNTPMACICDAQILNY